MKWKRFKKFLVWAAAGVLIAESVPAIVRADAAVQDEIQSEETAAAVRTVRLDHLISDDKSMQAARRNTKILQNALDDMSASGGGEVDIPPGTFYFKGEHAGFGQNYIIKARSNVHLKGAGPDRTVLKQYGDFEHTEGVSTVATAMFYYNNYRETNGKDTTFLVNADFSDFTVNGDEYTFTNAYDSGGQTFGFKLYEDCDFTNVYVLNSPATGFGCDSPKNSTFTDCYAENCGTAAPIDGNGASGFGIGTGIFDDESLTITNCRAVACKKFGFFFEHQGVFKSGSFQADDGSFVNLFPATEGNFVVQNCTARGNQYDFGARRGHNVTFRNCVAEAPEGSRETNLNKAAFYTEQHSKNITFRDCVSQKSYADVTPSAYYSDAAEWALNCSVTDPLGTLKFGTGTDATRGDVADMLYRMNSMPGIVYTRKEILQETPFKDVFTTDHFYDAVFWGLENEIMYGYLTDVFMPNGKCTRGDFITFLYRAAGSPSVETSELPFSDVSEKAYYARAVAWSCRNGIASGTSETKFSPTQTIKKEQAVTFLYRFVIHDSLDKRSESQ